MENVISSNQIVLISSNNVVIDFCRTVFEQHFILHVLSSINEITSGMSALFPVMLVDCVYDGRGKIQFEVNKLKLFRNDILLLGNKLPFDFNELHEYVPNVQFVLFPCDDDFLISIVSEKISKWTPSFEVTTLYDKKSTGAKYVDTKLHEDVKGFEKLIGKSETLYQAKAKLATVATKDVTLLLLGESGTGKSVAAELVHANSNRRNNVFKSINMASIPEGLAESTLFGSVKGAFTGAVNRHGIFAEADGGTLFMDEIGDLPLALQAKLLTVLDNGKFYSVGSDKETTVDVRIICATNADLETLVREKKFRKDLYYRITRVAVTLPPLRKHPEDIKMIAEKFLKKFAKRISDDAVKKLESHMWHGNVRELEGCLEAACVFCEGDTLKADDIELGDVS